MENSVKSQLNVLGLISLITSSLGFLIFIGSLPILTELDTTNPSAAVLAYSSIILEVIGLLTGLIGLAIRRSKLFAIIGISIAIFETILIFIIGAG